MAVGRVLAVTAAIVMMAGCGGPAGHKAAAVATVLPVTGHGVSGASRTLRGELAFVAQDRLFLAGGPAGRLRRVSLPGIPFAPAWSADHRWLAVEVSKLPPVSQPYADEPAGLWLVSAAGAGPRRLTPPLWGVTSFGWSPRADELAAVVQVARAPRARSSLVVTITLDGSCRVLAASSTITGAAWSPDGRLIAVGSAGFSSQHYLGTVEVLRPRGGPPAIVATSKSNVLDLGGWWPDGSGLLYWLDWQGSASLAADGLPLESASLAGRPPRQLTRTLVHGSWLALSPGGRWLAAVSGGERVIWSGGKHIVICQPAGRCAAVAQPGGVMSLDPSWSPDGTMLVFARLPASGPFGPNGHADFSPSWIRRWEATGSLWLASRPGASPRQLTAAGPGAVDPVWGSDGSVLFVRNDRVWLLPPGAAAAAPVTGPLGALTGLAFQRAYYGYIPYPQLIAWTLAQPPATIGAS